MSPMILLKWPALFQRIVKIGMNGLINVGVYIDDILLFSKKHFERKKN
jgi:hypothetical protein